MMLIRYFLLVGLVFQSFFLTAQTCRTTTLPETTPTASFTDQGDGTVLHNLTGLIWKRCGEGQTWTGTTCSSGINLLEMNWQEALEYVETLNNSGGFAGKTDWRLPNIKELPSIIERQCNTPAINDSIFPNTTPDSYWTSSPEYFSSGNSYQVSFNNGNYGGSNQYNDHAVRLVRND